MKYANDLVYKIIKRKERRLLKREALIDSDIPGDDIKLKARVMNTTVCWSYI